MNNTKYRFTLKSRNSKTGPIPVTTTEEKSCPDICPLKKNGCFADGGPLAIVWKQVETMGKDINALCDDIKALPQGQLWRHNQAGDLPHKEQNIDMLSMAKLITVTRGKRGFTYTHHKMNAHNKTIVGFPAHGMRKRAASEVVATFGLNRE